MNAHCQQSTANHKCKHRKQMLKHTGFEEILISALPKLLKLMLITMFEAVIEAARYITFERRFSTASLNDFKTDARERFWHIWNWTWNMCVVSVVGTYSAEGNPCSFGNTELCTKAAQNIVEPFVRVRSCHQFSNDKFFYTGKKAVLNRISCKDLTL